jgi:filamentous hemagglutinin family protein
MALKLKILGWKLMLASFSTACLLNPIALGKAAAQIVPDATLSTNSAVTSQGNTNIIIGGTTAGSNLFHSFQQFSINGGTTAYFNNSPTIQNILSRVTGVSASNIDGLIRANGTANLFLLNPNGIVFGPGATLEIGGSFVASTANSLKFADGTEFSASNSTASPLLAVSVPVGLQYGSQAVNGIQVQGANLQVQSGKSLTLVGGNVSLDGGSLVAPSGRVDLGGLAGSGTIELNEDRSLTFPEGAARADIQLKNASEINVRASDNGNIAITSRNLNISGGSLLRAGIESGMGTPQDEAGNININTTDNITITDGSLIANAVRTNAQGQGGDVNIIAGSLFISDSSQVNALTQGRGSAGSVTIAVRDTLSFNNSSGSFSTVADTAVGNAGIIKITAKLLFLTNGSQITASTFGQGNGGVINLNVLDSIFLDNSNIINRVSSSGVGNAGQINITGASLALNNESLLSASTAGQGNGGAINLNIQESISLDNSSIFNVVGSTGVGNAGAINVIAKSVLLTNNSQLTASTFGQGNSGVINLNIQDGIFLDNSSIFNNVVNGAVGNGGKINITTSSLSLVNGSQIVASTFSQGNAGGISITAKNNISLDGSNENGSKSGIFSAVDQEAVGNGGSINISSNKLLLSNGAQLNTSTFGKGNAGNILINVNDSITLSNTSYIVSSVQSGGVGQGGDITIQTRSLSLTDGSQVQSAVFRAQGDTPGGQGKGGSINIAASDSVYVSGVNTEGFSSGVLTITEQGALGQAGNITINTGNLIIENAAFINAATRNSSDGGSITINADTLTLTSGGQVFTTSRSSGNAGTITLNIANAITLAGSDTSYSERIAKFGSNIVSDAGPISGVFSRTTKDSAGQGGAINIKAGQLILKDGAQVSAITAGTGNAGNIMLNIASDITLTGVNSGIFAGTEVGSTGNGGNIMVRSQSLGISNHAVLSAASQGQGDAGNIAIDTGTLALDTDGSISGVMGIQAIGDGSTVSITANDLIATNGGNIITTTSSTQGGDAGSIVLNLLNSLTLSGVNSGLFANTEAGSTGKGGSISIDPHIVTIADGAAISVNSQGSGTGGSITLQAGSLTLNNGTISAATASSNGGNVDLHVNDLTLLNNNSQISATAGGFGDGGNLTIDTRFLIANNNSDITANAFQGRGGDIQIAAQGIFLSPNSSITASSDLGIDGTVQLNTPDVDPSKGLVALPETVVDVSNLVAQRCSASVARSVEQSEFIITGRGGLPPNPGDPLMSNSILTGWATLKPDVVIPNNAAPPPSATSSVPVAIVKAQGWIVDANGNIVLTAEPTGTLFKPNGQIPVSCHGL